MFSMPRFGSNRYFPRDLARLSAQDLDRLAGQLQDQIFRECNGRSGAAREQTLLRQALVDLELVLRKEGTVPPAGLTN